jgi:CelD/BcsL family acetyltransferase involved in cellulose biosynthesis
MTITEETFTSLASYWTGAKYNLRWDTVFVLPGWLRVWWQNFGSGQELYLRAVRRGEEVIGIAPLLVQGEVASIIGSADVCDYLDFVIAPGAERDFFDTLLDDLSQHSIKQLSLEALRPDSTVLTHLSSMAEERNYSVVYEEDGVSLELDLPSSWDGYLAVLDKKQRHELERKLRRLNEAGQVGYRCHCGNGELGDFMDAFLKLFSLSQKKKASFMTARMEVFFRSLAEAMAEIGLLRLGMLEIDGELAAMVMGFDYNDTMYLYNSCYDTRYRSLSVGILSKVLCIRESIQQGRKKWDFLKGGESYKYHLGGKEVPLYRCEIGIS